MWENERLYDNKIDLLLHNLNDFCTDGFYILMKKFWNENKNKINILVREIKGAKCGAQASAFFIIDKILN